MFGNKTVVAHTREELNEALESGASEIVVRGDSELLGYAQGVVSSPPPPGANGGLFSLPVIIAASIALAGVVSAAWFFLLAPTHAVLVSANKPAARLSDAGDANLEDFAEDNSTDFEASVLTNDAGDVPVLAEPASGGPDSYARRGAEGEGAGDGAVDPGANRPAAAPAQSIVVQLAWPFIVALALSFMFILALVGMLRGWNVRWKWNVTSHASGELILSRGPARSMRGNTGRGRRTRETPPPEVNEL